MSYVVGLWQEGVAVVLSILLLVGIHLLRVRARRNSLSRQFSSFSSFARMGLIVDGQFRSELLYVSPPYHSYHWQHISIGPPSHWWCDWEWEDDWWISKVAPGFSNLKSRESL